MKLSTKVVPSAKTQNIREEMWQLYQRFYKLDRTSFDQRFQRVQYYALYFTKGKLVGFTALKTKEVDDGKRKVMCIYTGQAVIDYQYRNQALIPRSCAYLTMQSFLQNPFRPIYVWCDSLTYKPYLAFIKATTYTYPTWRRATPENIQNIIHQLGKFYYGTNYQVETGTVKKNSNIVSDASTFITERDRQNPDINFYARINPNYLEGRGVITITQASIDNFIHCAWRCVKKRFGIRGRKTQRPSSWKSALN